jgi:hypothetical protein
MFAGIPGARVFRGNASEIPEPSPAKAGMVFNATNATIYTMVYITDTEGVLNDNTRECPDLISVFFNSSSPGKYIISRNEEN